MDRRQKKTRDSIFDAFGELLSRKSFSKITVQEIIDAADVGRTTFYAHFETKEDLLREMCIEIFDHVFADTRNADDTYEFPTEAETTDVLVAHILYHLSENRRNMLGILKCESSGIFLTIFREYLNRRLVPRIMENRGKKDGAYEDFLVDFISGSFVNMVRWWVDNDMEQSPTEMAEYYLKAVMPAVDPKR